jgi:ABC-2 type transport system permease protein
MGSGCVAFFLVLRAIADTTNGTGWIRWLSPLGWAEELQPFGASRPLAVLLPIAVAVVLIYVPTRMRRSRDVGQGLIPVHDSSEPRLGLLSSPTAQALRSARGTLLVWIGCVAAFGFVFGVISESVSSAGISKNIEREVAKLGSGSILTPRGYIAFLFFFVILAISLFACSQLAATRAEEADGQLETLLALPVGRVRWLGGRIVLATTAVCAIAVAAGLFTWMGATSVGVHIPIVRMLEAGANCIPVTLFFLGVAALAYSLIPRASTAVSYGIVLLTFLWQAAGSLLGAPRWAVDLTPFAYVGLVPTQSFRTTDAAVMVGLGLVAALLGLVAFRHRDLVGA